MLAGVCNRGSVCQNLHMFSGNEPAAVIRAETAGGVPHFPNDLRAP